MVVIPVITALHHRTLTDQQKESMKQGAQCSKKQVAFLHKGAVGYISLNAAPFQVV